MSLFSLPKMPQCFLGEMRLANPIAGGPRPSLTAGPSQLTRPRLCGGEDASCSNRRNRLIHKAIAVAPCDQSRSRPARLPVLRASTPTAALALSLRSAWSVMIR